MTQRCMMNTKAYAFAAIAVSLVACGKEPPVAGNPSPVVTQSRFLDGIPADTPYVAAAVDPAPLADILPWLQTLDDAATPSAERLDELLADPDLRPRKRRGLAILAELTGRLTPDGLRSLGFSASPRAVVYGIGVLPAVRIEIEDRAKVAAFLARIGERAGIESTSKQLDGEEYWTFPGVRDNRTVVIALRDKMLLAGVATPESESLFVEHLLGDVNVESMGDDDLRTLAASWGLANYSVGYLDLVRLAEGFFDPSAGLNADVWRKVDRRERNISERCKTETMSLVKSVPRFVFGSESWAPASLSFGGGIELRGELTTQLAATKTGAPLTGSTMTQDAHGVAGFGFQLGEVVQIVRDRAAAIDEQPFACEWYAGVNKAAGALASRWSMLPPAVAQIDGGTLLVRDLRRPTAADAPQPLEIDAVVALSTSTPVALFDFVKAFNNDVYPLHLSANGKPIALPSTRGLDRLQQPEVVAQPGALAVTSGTWSGDELSAATLERQPAPFLFLSYDAEKIAERLDLGDAGRPLQHALRGTSRIEVEPTPRGLQVRSVYTREIGE